MLVTLENMLEWIKTRWSERSTWDGTVLVVLGIVALLFSPLIKWVAAAAIAYGIWRIWEKEVS